MDISVVHRPGVRCAYQHKVGYLYQKTSAKMASAASVQLHTDAKEAENKYKSIAN